MPWRSQHPVTGTAISSGFRCVSSPRIFSQQSILTQDSQARRLPFLARLRSYASPKRPVIHGAGEPRRRGGKVYWMLGLGPTVSRPIATMPRTDTDTTGLGSPLDALLRGSRRPDRRGSRLGASVSEVSRGGRCAAPPWLASFWSPRPSRARTSRICDSRPIWGSPLAYPHSLYHRATTPRAPSSISERYRVSSPRPRCGFWTGAATSSDQARIPRNLWRISAASRPASQLGAHL